MFGWDILKCGVPESVRLCIGDLPMYICFHTDPSLVLTNVDCPNITLKREIKISINNWTHETHHNLDICDSGQEIEKLVAVYVNFILEKLLHQEDLSNLRKF